jgi:hypothetical protein
MDRRETEREDLDWIHVTLDRDQGDAIVNMVRNHRIP